MKRHPGLHPLARDHYQVLIHAQRLQRAAEGTAPLVDTTARFLAFWQAAAAAHLRTEEEVLLPYLLARCPLADDPSLQQCLQDHADLRRLVLALKQQVVAHDEEKIRVALGELGQRLIRHTRLEDRTVFPLAEERLTEAELSEIGRLCAPPEANVPRLSPPFESPAPCSPPTQPSLPRSVPTRSSPS